MSARSATGRRRSRPLAPGAQIAPGYEAIAHLSRGRRLDVYDAWSEERGCRCVVKVIRPERAGEARSRQALIEEGEMLERLTHPHVVRAYETLLDPQPAVVLETLSGQTLAHMIEEEQRELSAVEIGHLGLQLGSAVRYLHANGILHLDLKPSNIVAEAGRAKLIDLSVARSPGPAPAGVGTWSYMAPEQATGGRLGPAADVWGIGVVLFEAATGQPAFTVPSDEDGSLPSATSEAESVTWESSTGSYPQLGSRAPRVASIAPAPAPLADLIDACLEPEPAMRPGVAALMGTLEWIAEIPPPERRWSGSGSPARRSSLPARRVE